MRSPHCRPKNWRLSRRLRIGELLGAARSSRSAAVGERFRAGCVFSPAGGDRFWGDGGNKPPTSRGTSSGTPREKSTATPRCSSTSLVSIKPQQREIPAAWNDFLGCYGPEFIPLVVSVKHGHLYAMTENMLDYSLASSIARVSICRLECTSARSWWAARQAAAFTPRCLATWS